LCEVKARPVTEHLPAATQKRLGTNCTSDDGDQNANVCQIDRRVEEEGGAALRRKGAPRSEGNAAASALADAVSNAEPDHHHV
jgi:hypothetical protein